MAAFACPNADIYLRNAGVDLGINLVPGSIEARIEKLRWFR